MHKSTSCADNFLRYGLIIVRYSMLQNKASARQAWNQQITYNRYHSLVLLIFRNAVYKTYIFVNFGIKTLEFKVFKERGNDI